MIFSEIACHFIAIGVAYNYPCHLVRMFLGSGMKVMAIRHVGAKIHMLRGPVGITGSAIPRSFR